MPPAKKPRSNVRRVRKIGGFKAVDIATRWYKNRQRLLELKPSPQYILNALRNKDPKNYFFRNVDLSNAKIEPDSGTPAINILFHQKTKDTKLFGWSTICDFEGIGPVAINFINTAQSKLAEKIKKHEREHVRTYAHRFEVEKKGFQAVSEAVLHELISCLAEEKRPASKRELNAEINRIRRRLTKELDGLIETLRGSGYRDDLLEHLKAHNLKILEKNLEAIREAMGFLSLGEIRTVIRNSYWSLIDADLQRRIYLTQKYKQRKKYR